MTAAPFLFEVHVSRNATVAELKVAIEEIFTSLLEEVQGNISWSHVWGHFCLSYEGQKLINNKVCIRYFGIKDGDQLQFIRHMSLNQSASRKRSKSQNAPCKRLSSSSSGHQEKEENAVDHKDEKTNQEDSDDCCEDEQEFPIQEFKLRHFLRRWLSYPRLWGVSGKGSEGRTRPSRFALQCLGGRAGMLS